MDGQRGAGEHAKRCVRKRQDSPRMKVAFIPLRDEFADVVSSQYALLGHRLPASLLEGAMVIPMICIGNAARVRPRNNREMNLHHCQTPTSAEGNVAKNFERYACSINCASILKQNMRKSLRRSTVADTGESSPIRESGSSVSCSLPHRRRWDRFVAHEASYKVMAYSWHPMESRFRRNDGKHAIPASGPGSSSSC